jgi:PAS domain S-box-containing protein
MEVREKNIFGNQKLFVSIIQNSLDSFSLLDHTGAIIYTGPATQRILGHIPEERIGKNIFDSVPVAFQDFARKSFAELILAPGKKLVVECPYLHSNGTPLWLEITAVNLLDDKDVGAVVANYRDITDKKKMEDALRKSEERYRLLFDSNPVPMWVFDNGSLAFLAVNDSAVEFYGYSREEFLSMTIKDIRPAEDLPVVDVINNIAKHLNGLVAEGTWKLVKKDGTEVIAEMTRHELRFEGRQATLVLANDVTVKIKAEQEIKRNEKIYKTLIDSFNLPLLYVQCGEQAGMYYANELFYAATGFSPSELEQMPAGDIMDISILKEAAGNTETPVAEINTQIRVKGNKWVEAKVRLTPFFDENRNKEGCWLAIAFR